MQPWQIEHFFSKLKKLNKAAATIRWQKMFLFRLQINNAALDCSPQSAMDLTARETGRWEGLRLRTCPPAHLREMRDGRRAAAILGNLKPL